MKMPFDMSVKRDYRVVKSLLKDGDHPNRAGIKNGINLIELDNQLQLKVEMFNKSMIRKIPKWTMAVSKLD